MKPEKLAPRANARSFVLTVLMPIAAAAVSSSRMAIQARPRRLSRSRTQMPKHDQQQDQRSR